MCSVQIRQQLPKEAKSALVPGLESTEDAVPLSTIINRVVTQAANDAPKDSKETKESKSGDAPSSGRSVSGLDDEAPSRSLTSECEARTQPVVLAHRAVSVACCSAAAGSIQSLLGGQSQVVGRGAGCQRFDWVLGLVVSQLGVVSAFVGMCMQGKSSMRTRWR